MFGDNGGIEPILFYRVTDPSVPAFFCGADGHQYSCVISNLAPSTTYIACVQVEDVSGYSSAFDCRAVTGR